MDRRPPAVDRRCWENQMRDSRDANGSEEHLLWTADVNKTKQQMSVKLNNMK
jgi:hypothetical protein